MNQCKKGTSLSTTHLSPLAKPFTFNPSSSSNHSTDDPFSYLLDSFQNNDLGSKHDYKVSTLPTQTHEKSLFEQYPSLEFRKNSDFYGLNWSHFDIVDSTYSPNVTGLGYGKQRVDSHESLLCKGNNGRGSVDNGSMVQQVASIMTRAVHCELYLQTDYMQKNRVSKVFAQSGQNSFASSCDQCNEKNNEIGQFQFIQRSISKSLEFEKQMPSEALLFRNLWLDCEAECLYRRYKTYHYLMEAGIDVNYTNVEDDIKIGS